MTKADLIAALERVKEALEYYAESKLMVCMGESSLPMNFPGQGDIAREALTELSAALSEIKKLLPDDELATKRESGEPATSFIEAMEICQLCHRETKVTYYKSWSRSYDCEGCGFHDLHGILGEPPYKQIEDQPPQKLLKEEV